MAERKPLGRGWLLVAVAVALAIGAGAGAALALTTSGRSHARNQSAAMSQANVTWKAGERAAPDFSLRDQTGAPISLAANRGRPVILTFIDPVCTSLCPLEAKVLGQVEQQLPAAQRPVIVSVSVNPWANARRYLRQDIRKWHLPSSWRWAVGSHTRLARVWRDYAVAVQIRVFRAVGVTEHRVDHTEGAYLIDRSGYKRALFLWPFAAADVTRAVRNLGS
jgi:cytochrome oxidase Cu insertion factor (SCO1/SenC/PrrC family)